MAHKISIVEDEKDILDLLSEIFLESGYEVKAYTEAEKLLQNLNYENLPDLFLIDLMLPGISGLELCKLLKNREQAQNIPIIILTARGDEFDILNGFNMGCEDYITKPFSKRILLARINAVLSRVSFSNSKNKENLIRFKDLTIDPISFEVYIKNKIVKLTRSEFKILFLLFKNSKRVFTREQLIQNVKIFDNMNERSIDTIIARIRKKIGVYGKYVKTIYGVGYKISIESEEKINEFEYSC